MTTMEMAAWSREQSAELRVVHRNVLARDHVLLCWVPGRSRSARRHQTSNSNTHIYIHIYIYIYIYIYIHIYDIILYYISF